MKRQWGFNCASLTLLLFLSTLYRNAGMDMEVKGHRVISSVALEAVDQDTPSHQLYYILSVGPKFGLLQLKVTDRLKDYVREER